MAIYISVQSLKQAVERLSVSAAQTSLADYLIFKRALANARTEARQRGRTEPQTVVTGTKSAAFVRAVEEFSLRIPPGRDDPRKVDHPYYLPFGSKRDTGLGYRTWKFPSNGSSDTVSRWQSRSAKPIVHVPDTSPKEFKIERRSPNELQGFFTIKGAQDNFSGRLPLLTDAAIWWFRFSDLEERVGPRPTPMDVVNAFVADLELNATELGALFANGAADSVALSFASECAPSEQYLPAAPAERTDKGSRVKLPSRSEGLDGSEGSFQGMVDETIAHVATHGFVFEPWQVASFITAVRTKPFILLAGISGTGKSKLPRLVANATGSEHVTIPVRPDWTDSSDLVGFERIDSTFQPGALLQLAKRAIDEPAKQFFLILDEMNIARVEYYLAEVLSLLEDRQVDEAGSLVSPPMVTLDSEAAKPWRTIGLPGNLCIVGSVNMDETTHGFSRKVLDRAFAIEFGSPDLTAIGNVEQPRSVQPWPISAWKPAALSLAAHPESGSPFVQDIVETLVAVNDILKQAQLNFGYRVRDEVVLFCLAARDCAASFVTSDAAAVDPLDLAIGMKILPRLQGSGPLIQQVLKSLHEWSAGANTVDDDSTIMNSGFPFCAERLSIMLHRLQDTGFASYWL